MKAIIFARVSDKKQDSNDAQLMRISEYVVSKGLTMWKKEAIEESSTSGERKKFRAIINEIRKLREPVALVVDTVDRLQRSFYDSVILDDLRKSGKLEIHFYRENLIVNQHSNSADLLRWDMGVMFARSYVLQLKDNMARKFEQMRKDGLFPHAPPIGYVSTYDAKGKRNGIAPDPRRSHLIAELFRLYATGTSSIKALAARMYVLGLKTASGKCLSNGMIEYILKNPFYCGYMLYEGALYTHKYQPLVTRQLFDECRKVRESWNKKPFAYATKPFVLRGLVRCARCGCSMSPQMAKGKYVYYRCSNGRPDVCKAKIYVPEKVLVAPVYDVLRRLHTIPQEVLEQIVTDLQRAHEAKREYHNGVIRALQAEYTALQAKIDRLMEVYLEGESRISKEDFDRKLKEFKQRQFEISAQLEDHTRADESYIVTAQKVFDVAKNALLYFESSKVLEKRALLNFLLQNFRVDGKKPLFELRKPFDTLVEIDQLRRKLRR